MDNKTKQLSLRKMKLDAIKPGSLIVNVGKRGSGKTFLTKSILYELRDKVKLIVVFSSTEDVNAFYRQFVPKAFIHTDLDISRLQNIYYEQKALVASNRERARRNKVTYHEHSYDDNLLVIIDDFMHKKQIFKSEVLKDIAFNGRHCNITFLFNIQYAMVLPPEYRSQIDVCFMFKEVIQANKKRLYDYYAGMFSTYAEFSGVFDKLTKDWECMVIKMTNTDDECARGGIENMVFWYKASVTPKFKIGHKMLWQHDKQHEEKRNVEIDAAKKNKTAVRTIRIV